MLDEEPIVLDDEEPAARPRPSAGTSSVAAPVVVLEPVEPPVPEPVIGPPPRAPWGSRIEGHRPVHHPELVTPRRDFIEELRRAARRL